MHAAADAFGWLLRQVVRVKARHFAVLVSGHRAPSQQGVSGGRPDNPCRDQPGRWQQLPPHCFGGSGEPGRVARVGSTPSRTAPAGTDHRGKGR